MSDFIAGLDLGQMQDYTALAVLERQGEDAYHCRHLQRYKLGTKYNRIVDRVAGLVQSEALDGKCDLVIDHTGVGTAVFDMFAEAGLRPIGVSIHGGDKVSREGRLCRVPKRDLVSVLQILLQNGRLKVAESLPEAQTLISEALNFRVKISDAGHDSYAAWREGEHDDLVLAVALAAWYAERGRKKAKARARVYTGF